MDSVKKLALLNDKFARLFKDKEITITISPLILHFVICMALECLNMPNVRRNEREKLLMTINCFVGMIQDSIPESKPLFEEFKELIKNG